MKHLKTIVIYVATSVLLGCSIDEQKLPLIIDADTANEVDDLYAIVRALEAPELEVLGITSAQFHTSPLATDSTVRESQDINEKIVSLMRKQMTLPMGANEPLKDGAPNDSEAARFIIEKARSFTPEDPLHIVILGSCTNVASAILLSPEIVPNIYVHYLGFWHTPETNEYNKKEFNSGNDTTAVEVLLNNPDLKLDVMTATTSQHLVFTKEEVDMHLADTDDLGAYLINRWETYTRWWTEEDTEKRKWIMWDIAIIEALINPSNATLEMMNTPPENTQRKIGIYTSIDVEAMKASYWGAVDAR